MQVFKTETEKQKEIIPNGPYNYRLSLSHTITDDIH